MMVLVPVAQQLSRVSLHCSCEKCNKLRNGIKFSRVLELPEMLCVHLKRFRHDLSYSSKISSPVHFPLIGLDMRPYLHKECKSEVSTYDLTAVICHHGTVGGGHYTSFAKHEYSGKWFEFDDQLVTQVSPEVVQNCEAYVLFYRKTNPHMHLIRQKALEMDDIGSEQASDIRFFVSRQWLNKFKTFAEPGPIDNRAWMCPHGGLPPRKWVMASRLVVPLPQQLWDYLFMKFGGGPACNHLYECDICRQAADQLARRQNYELEAFSAYKDETTSTIYAISMAWFRQWQLFVGTQSDDIPGPINNKTIANQTDGTVTRGVKPGSDYAQINSTLWKFFFNIYGGGPEIILRGNPAEESRSTTATTSPNLKEDRGDANDEQFDRQTPAGPQPTAEPAHQPQDQVTVRPEAHHQPQSVPSSPTEQKQPTQSAMEVDKKSPVEPQMAQNRKVTKNVSFESDAVADRDGGSDQEMVVTNLKRGKHYYTAVNSSNSEIVAKKDKRHRGGIKNSLFGAEGKCIDATV